MDPRYPRRHLRGNLGQSQGAHLPLIVDQFSAGIDISPELYFDELRISPRSGPVLLNTGAEVVSFGPRTRTGGSRFHGPAAEQILSEARMIMTGQGRHLRDPRQVPLRSGHDGCGEQGIDRVIVRQTDNIFRLRCLMQELYRKLGAATKFYNNFVSEYEKEIASIKKYSTNEILENLWTRRVRGTRDETGYNDNDFIEHEDKFAEWKKKVTYALDRILKSSLDGGNPEGPNNSIRHQSMLRLVEKIHTANRQILPLLDDASQGQEYCKDLIMELELLKTLVNPDSDNNQKLFKDDDYDDAEESIGERQETHWGASASNWGGDSTGDRDM